MQNKFLVVPSASWLVSIKSRCQWFGIWGFVSSAIFFWPQKSFQFYSTFRNYFHFLNGIFFSYLNTKLLLRITQFGSVLFKHPIHFIRVILSALCEWDHKHVDIFTQRGPSCIAMECIWCVCRTRLECTQCQRERDMYLLLLLNEDWIQGYSSRLLFDVCMLCFSTARCCNRVSHN